MKTFRDGDALCVTLDDFTDLQASPAVFIEGENAALAENAGLDVACILQPELYATLATLLLPDRAKQIFPNTRPLYRAFFLLHEQYMPPLRPVIETIEPFSPGVVACWTTPSRNIDFGEWERKGSLGVDGFFIHDDYRVGDCLLFEIPAAAEEAASK